MYRLWYARKHNKLYHIFVLWTELFTFVSCSHSRLTNAYTIFFRFGYAANVISVYRWLLLGECFNFKTFKSVFFLLIAWRSSLHTSFYAGSINFNVYFFPPFWQTSHLICIISDYFYRPQVVKLAEILTLDIWKFLFGFRFSNE